MPEHASTIAIASAQPYDVRVGFELDGLVVPMLGPDTRRVAVIRTASVGAVAQAVMSELDDAGIEVHGVVVPEGEGAKTAQVLADSWAALAQAGLTRSDAVVAVGGGAVTDLGGFIAATYLRGVRCVHVPTTLLGMVDAAVGGKTGVNLAEGKNLVGAFHEPSGVVCDLATLRTLDAAEITNGLAEVIKCGFIADPAIIERVLADPRAVADPTSGALREVVERAITVKADAVAGDLREATSVGAEVGRERLNYGHTFGHAVELDSGFRLRHGEAVSVGMMFAAELAQRSGRIPAALVDQHAEVLGSVGLPLTYAEGEWPNLLATMQLDKKTRGNRLRFVVLAGRVGAVEMLEAPSDEALAGAFQAVGGCRG